MNKKIVGILVMMLFIVSTLPLAVTKGTNEEDNIFTIDIAESLGSTPTLTDNSGKTTFYGIFIAGGIDAKGSENDAKALHDLLDEDNGNRFKGWKDENKKYIPPNEATQISKDIKSFQSKAKPGDEFIFYYSGEGSNEVRDDGKTNKTREKEEKTPDPKDEKDDYDNSLELETGSLSDDELAEWLSGFNESVTITVILDSCYSGTFTDGTKDLPSATNSNGQPYGESHLALKLASKEETYGHPYKWVDKNKDSNITPDELEGPLKENTITHEIVWDKNNNNVKDAGDEVVPENQVRWIGDFTKEIMEGLMKKGGNLGFYEETTEADINDDGITTSKELFEYAIYHLNEDLGRDNDNDGQFDEDGYDHQTYDNGTVVFLYIDNDDDGWIDEDPAPPNSLFWPNERPDKPDKPSGQTSGKVGETYEYRATAVDPDGDNLFYLFDWGDSNNSDWIGPFSSNQQIILTNSWNEPGDYEIKCKVKDGCFVESEWSDPLSVTMPKNKMNYYFNYLFERFLHRFPFFEKILNLN